MIRRIWICFAALAATVYMATSATAQLPVGGAILWLDATDASTFDLDGEFINEWRDKSGNEYDALPVADAGPIRTTNGMNGKPSVRFEAEGADGMEILDFFLEERPYTAFVVNQYWGDRRGRTLQGADANWLLGLWAGNIGHYAEGWVTPQQPARGNFVYYATAVGTETDSSMSINGLDYTTNAAPLGSPGGLGLVGAGAFAGELSDADISEVIFYDRALSEAEVSSVESYLQNKYGATPCLTVADCIVPADSLNVIAGNVGTFTTASDLDFQGDFVYGINVGGPALIDDFDPIVIGDVTLVGGTNEDEADLNEMGVTMTVANQINNWFAATIDQFGDGSLDDDNLAFALQSIRWNTPPGIDVTMAVEEGQSYKLQLLMGEACCTRGFDIFVEGEMVVDNLLVSDVQDGVIDGVAEGINKGDTGVFYSYEFTAGDSELNVTLGGALNGAPDNNPILHVLTLEKIEDIGPVCDPNTGGDLDGNGTVEFADFLILSGNFGAAVADHTQGDIDCNGTVEFADFLVLSGNFGQAVAGAQSVPEPATNLLVLCAGLIGLVARRRRS